MTKKISFILKHAKCLLGSDWAHGRECCCVCKHLIPVHYNCYWSKLHGHKKCHTSAGFYVCYTPIMENAHIANGHGACEMFCRKDPTQDPILKKFTFTKARKKPKPYQMYAWSQGGSMMFGMWNDDMYDQARWKMHNVFSYKTQEMK